MIFHIYHRIKWNWWNKVCIWHSTTRLNIPSVWNKNQKKNVDTTRSSLLILLARKLCSALFSQNKQCTNAKRINEIQRNLHEFSFKQEFMVDSPMCDAMRCNVNCVCNLFIGNIVKWQLLSTNMESFKHGCDLHVASMFTHQCIMNRTALG